MLPSKHMMLQLCFNYRDLLRIKHPLILSDLFLHRIGNGGDITDLIGVKFLFLFNIYRTMRYLKDFVTGKI